MYTFPLWKFIMASPALKLVTYMDLTCSLLTGINIPLEGWEWSHYPIKWNLLLSVYFSYFPFPWAIPFWKFPSYIYILLMKFIFPVPWGKPLCMYPWYNIWLGMNIVPSPSALSSTNFPQKYLSMPFFFHVYRLLVRIN